MTLKEELELLRGKPIALRAPADQVPCIETSDPERLCRHPLVSVNMITYNHEPYIRQAIEGVMMQKTDFEFELVIGEDASEDKTREICFEYQKRYPDKIRVLWSEKNVNDIGGNPARVMARCRGEFIAFCEGDDYWIDPLKLQKQVDVMRKYPNVGLCFCNAKFLYEDSGRIVSYDYDYSGLLKGSDFFLWCASGIQPKTLKLNDSYRRTVTSLFRKSIYRLALEKYECFQWKLCMGDTTTWLALSSLSDLFYLKDVTSVYRKHSGGVSSCNMFNVWNDGILIQFYFCKKNLKWNTHKILNMSSYGIFLNWMLEGVKKKAIVQKEMANRIRQNEMLQFVFSKLRTSLGIFLLSHGLLTPFTLKFASRFFRFFQK